MLGGLPFVFPSDIYIVFVQELFQDLPFAVFPGCWKSLHSMYIFVELSPDVCLRHVSDL